MKDLDLKEKEFFLKQRADDIDELVKLLNNLKDGTSMHNWRNSKNVLKEKIDKIFLNYEFSLNYSAIKNSIKDSK